MILISGCVHNEGWNPAATPGTALPAVPAAGMDSCTATGDQPHNGSILVLNEAERQLAVMNSSQYMHTTFVDEENGICNYDCSGFVGYTLSRADPCAYRVLRYMQTGSDEQPETFRPEADDFYYSFLHLGTVPGNGSWMKIPAPAGLRPGDIIVWLKPDTSDSKSTGHIMIVSGTPLENPERKGELLVRVIDSTTSPHSGDTRGTGMTGLGEGTIGIMTDSSGLPVGYYWRGGESEILQKTEMAFARIA